MIRLRRKAVRAVLVDPQDRVLLMRIRTPNGWQGWITPGGGIETGESEATALRREIYEETGQRAFEVKGVLGHRMTSFPWKETHYFQEETVFWVKTPVFEIQKILIPDEMERLGFQEFRWWSLSELVQTQDKLAPEGLAKWLEFVLTHGLPSEPFEERKLGEHSVPSSFALAPMTNGQSQPDGSLGDAEFRWLESRAKGGFGVVITCAANVLKEGQGWKGELGVFDDAHKPGLKRLATMIRSHGALGIVQIFDGGAKAPLSVTGQRPRSCSEFSEGSERVREMEPEEIDALIGAFGKAARRCRDSGFHGVEIHGANGYILTQFLNPRLNQRHDKWGTSLENRQRLLLEVSRSVRASLGPGDILGLRISPEYWDPSTRELAIPFRETLNLIDRLNEFNLDYLHLSMRRFEAHPEDTDFSGSPLVTQVRERLKPEIKLMVAGGVRSPQDAKQLMQLGADFVALGSGAILNPAWPRDFHQSRGWSPELGPVAESVLIEQGLSPHFVQYLRRFPQGFVSES
jgi:2,4-dienoyl-CoA reductase-like NADH-dependent reductase (Old Yellow Enzyme family)/8-oxo-dGTP pyrophosphatase MutT (NUDIX family)